MMDSGLSLVSLHERVTIPWVDLGMEIYEYGWYRDISNICIDLLCYDSSIHMDIQIAMRIL